MPKISSPSTAGWPIRSKISPPTLAAGEDDDQPEQHGHHRPAVAAAGTMAGFRRGRRGSRSKGDEESQ